MSDVLTLEAAQVAEASPGIVPMSPWVIQSIVYELLTRFFQAQPPESLGYPLKLKYDPDKAKSDIYVNIAYNYDASLANKRPSIFISRGDCDIAGKTMGHQVPRRQCGGVHFSPVAHEFGAYQSGGYFCPDRPG
jgi:hypothetical protein